MTDPKYRVGERRVFTLLPDGSLGPELTPEEVERLDRERSKDVGHFKVESIRTDGDVPVITIRSAEP